MFFILVSEYTFKYIFFSFFFIELSLCSIFISYLNILSLYLYSNLYLFSCSQLVGNRVVTGNNNNNNNNVNPSLTPCTRILAMNMIGDLMRKVGVSIIIIFHIYICSSFVSKEHLVYKDSFKHGLCIFEF